MSDDVGLGVLAGLWLLDKIELAVKVVVVVLVLRAMGVV